MASKALTLLVAGPVPSAWTQDKEDAQDLGAYKTLEVAFEILALSSGGTDEDIFLEHAAVNEEGAYVRLAGAEATVSADGTMGTNYVQVNGFLRYVRAATETLTASPVVGIRIVAKE